MLQFETLTKVSAPVGLIVVVLLPFLWNYLRSPLKSYPGPFASKFTDLWRALDVFNGRCDITQNELHHKHGIAVRMGPNVLSISDPNEVSRVFTVKKPWKKVSCKTLDYFKHPDHSIERHVQCKRQHGPHGKPAFQPIRHQG